MKGITPEILKRCKRGDRKAQSELYEACFGFLMAVCRRYTRNEDDAHAYLNLAFYKILTKLNRYKTDLNFKAWSKTILVNSIIDEIRKDKRYRQYVGLAEETGQQAMSADLLFESDAVDAEEIYQYIRSLPPVTATVFNLYALDGYKHREIGKKLGMSENTSKWHFHEAKKRLQVMVIKGMERKKKAHMNKAEAVEI